MKPRARASKAKFSDIARDYGVQVNAVRKAAAELGFGKRRGHDPNCEVNVWHVGKIAELAKVHDAAARLEGKRR
jgi:hypothetical protein